ncbi:MAG: TAXI family TRAP transporter solute-binding subunit [bacterium]
MNRKKLNFSIGLFFIMALTLVTTDVMARVKTFTITSGPMGGGWYSIGGATGEMAKEAFAGAIVTVTPGGALSNVAKVNAGQADLGLTMARIYNEARTATGVYEGKKKMENLRAIAYLAPIPMSFVLVKQSNPLSSIEEIKEKKLPIRILTSKKGSSPALAGAFMFAQYGITFDDIKAWGGSVSYVSYAEASNLIKDGHADAWVGPVVSAIMELTTTVKMKMLPIKLEYLDQLQQNYSYGKIFLPKGKYYFVETDLYHMAENVIMVVQKDLGTEEVYQLMKVLMRKKDRIAAISSTYAGFDEATAWQHVGGPLHPGAEKYYREMNLMK